MLICKLKDTSLRPLKRVLVGGVIQGVDRFVILPEPHLVMTGRKHTIIRRLSVNTGNVENVIFMWRYKCPIILREGDSYTIVEPSDIDEGKWCCRRIIYDSIVECGEVDNLIYKDGKFLMVNPFSAPSSSLPVSASDLIFVSTPTHHGLFTLDALLATRIDDVVFIDKVAPRDIIIGYLLLAPGNILLYYRDAVTALWKTAMNTLVYRPLGNIVGLITAEEARCLLQIR